VFIQELRARVAAGEKKATIAREFGISRETLYTYVQSNHSQGQMSPRGQPGGFFRVRQLSLAQWKIVLRNSVQASFLIPLACCLRDSADIRAAVSFATSDR